MLILNARLLHLLIFSESYPNAAWQVAIFMLIFNVIFIYTRGRAYLSLYVGLDKIDLDKI